MKLFGPSWRTTVGGILAAVGIGLRHAPEARIAAWSDVFVAAGVAIIGFSARDNTVTSAQVHKPKLVPLSDAPTT